MLPLCKISKFSILQMGLKIDASMEKYIKWLEHVTFKDKYTNLLFCK